MANTYRYSHLNQEELMNYYAITKQEEFEFVKNYREKLKASIEKILHSISFWEPSYKYEGIKDIVNLSQNVKKFMSEANPKNIMSKLRFVNNISREVFALKTEMEREGWIFSNGEDINAFLKSIEVFLKAVSSEAIQKDGMLEKCKQHLNKEMATYLIEDLKNNFLKFIDMNEPSSFDIYYFLGACLKKQEDLEKEATKLRDKHCSSCQKDDCILTPCLAFSEIQKLEKEARNYQKMAEACTNIMFSVPQDKIEISKTLSKTSNQDFKELFNFFLNKPEDKGVPQKRKIFGKEQFLINIIESDVKKEILSRLDDGGKIDYKNVDHVAIVIIEALYDFSNSLGSEEINKFMHWVDAYEKAKESVQQNTKGTIVNIKQLFEEYKKQNNIEKI